MPPLTPLQRNQVSQFMGLTGVPEKTAQRVSLILSASAYLAKDLFESGKNNHANDSFPQLLKASGWKIENASDR